MIKNAIPIISSLEEIIKTCKKTQIKSDVDYGVLYRKVVSIGQITKDALMKWNGLDIGATEIDKNFR